MATPHQQSQHQRAIEQISKILEHARRVNGERPFTITITCNERGDYFMFNSQPAGIVRKDERGTGL